VHRIIQATPNADFTLDLQFEDGRRARVSLSDLVDTAPIAAPFRDLVRFIGELTIVENGDVLRWSDQFELHADSLRYRAFPDELERDYGLPRGSRRRPAA